MKKYLMSVLILLSCLLLFAACSRGTDCPNPKDVLIGQEEGASALEPQVKITFTQEELLADYDQCWELLEENYPFLPVLEGHGVDIQGVKESCRQTLIERVTDVNGLFVLLQQMFGSMENFAHLGVVSQYTYQILYQYYQPGDGRDAELYHDPQTAATYAALPELVAGRGEYPEPEVETFYYPDLKVAYFHFQSFAYPYTEDSVVGDYLDQLAEEGLPIEHVIIDITGNGGGNTRNVDNDIIAPLGGGIYNKKFYCKDTAITRTDFIPLGFVEVEDPSLEPAFVKELGMTHFFAYTKCVPGLEEIHAHNAHRWLLINERCYSASEYLISFCKETGLATIVGRTSLGDGAVGTNPSTIRLDHTGLLIRFSVLSAANTDGSLNAERGERPDYPCKPSESPLRKCMELIRGEEETDK